jgi:hypothetical protein
MHNTNTSADWGCCCFCTSMCLGYVCIAILGMLGIFFTIVYYCPAYYNPCYNDSGCYITAIVMYSAIVCILFIQISVIIIIVIAFVVMIVAASICAIIIECSKDKVVSTPDSLGIRPVFGGVGRAYIDIVIKTE